MRWVWEGWALGPGLVVVRQHERPRRRRHHRGVLWAVHGDGAEGGGEMTQELARIENVIVKRETDKALYVEVDGVGAWIPKSQIHDDSEVYSKDTEGALVVPLWLAEEKGLA